MLVVFAVSLVVLLVMPAFALADRERELEVEIEDWEISIESRCTINGKTNELSIEFDADEAEIEIEYEEESGTAEKEMELEVEFLRLIEYQDNNGDGIYNAGDLIIKEYKVRDSTFTTPTHKRVRIDNSTGYEISCVYTIGGGTIGGGRLGLKFIILNESANVSGELLKPTWMKINITIDYPELSDTLLCLEIGVESEVETEGGSNEGLEELRAQLHGYVGFFDWERQAMVDGTIKDVKSVIMKTTENVERDSDETELENERIVYLCYPRGERIIHDPIVGIRESALPGFLGVPMTVWYIGIVVAVAAIAIGIVLYARKRK